MTNTAIRASGAALVMTALIAAAAGCGGGTHRAGPTTTPTITAPTSPPATAQAEPSVACGRNEQRAAVEQVDVTVDGTPRSALVHLPASRTSGTEPLPVVLSFHGVNGNAAVQRATDGLVEKSDEEGFVVVHPEGLMVGLNDQVTGITGWDADGSEVDEPRFVSAVLDELGSRTCIDAARVFVTGFSAGGNIALVVACALPERIAAVAPVSAAYQPGECTSAGPLPILAFHGLDDIVVPFDGRDTPDAGTLVPVRDEMDARAEGNSCTGGPETTELSPRVRSLTWSGCTADTTLVELDDHGHAWPGHPMPFSRDVLLDLFVGGDGRPRNPLMVAIGERPDTMADNVLLTNDDVDATDLIWEFFSGRR